VMLFTPNGLETEQRPLRPHGNGDERPGKTSADPIARHGGQRYSFNERS
jgi:hypothetical protein